MMMSSGLNGCNVYRDAIQAKWNDGWTLWWSRLQEEQILIKCSELESAIATPVLCDLDDVSLSSIYGIVRLCTFVKSFQRLLQAVVKVN